jgi:hypothetical protein
LIKKKRRGRRRRTVEEEIQKLFQWPYLTSVAGNFIPVMASQNY